MPHPITPGSRAFKSKTPRGSLNRLEWYIQLRQQQQRAGVPRPIGLTRRNQPEASVTPIQLHLTLQPHDTAAAERLQGPLSQLALARGKPRETLKLFVDILKEAVILNQRVTLEHDWPQGFDADVDPHLMEDMPAVVQKAEASYPTLVILDPSLPAKELGNIWGQLLPGPKTSKLYDKEGTQQANLEDSWKQTKLSQKNPRSIALETELLGRLAYELVLSGYYLGEGDASFHYMLMDLWWQEAPKHGLDPRKYADGERSYEKRSAALGRIRSALSNLERKFSEEGKPSPFRKPDPNDETAL